MALSCFVSVVRLLLSGSALSLSALLCLAKSSYTEITLDIISTHFDAFRRISRFRSLSQSQSFGLWFWEANSFGHMPCTFAKILRNWKAATVIIHDAKFAKCNGSFQTDPKLHFLSLPADWSSRIFFVSGTLIQQTSWCAYMVSNTHCRICVTNLYNLCPIVY